MSVARTNRRRAQRTMLILALALWTTSVSLPAIEVPGGPTLSGYDILLQGWSAWRNGVFAWFANPLLGAAVVLGWREHSQAATVCAVLGLVLATTSFWAAATGRAGGAAVPEVSFEVGFYCWIGAHIAAAGGALGDLAVRKFGAPR